MKLIWEEKAWADDCEWQQTDKKTLKRINEILRDIQRNTYSGIGKPEPLKNNYSGWWSRRINDCDRVVYKIKDDAVVIASCKGHYN